jgi:hypothetical protein
LRVVIALVLAVLAGFMPRVVAVQAVCHESCPDDDEDGRCPPGCMDCTCCVRAPSMARVEATLPVPPTPHLQRARPADETIPASAELREVLHIPKLSVG